MFEEFFGFTRTPFARDIPVGDLFPAKNYLEFVGRLVYAAEKRQFGLFMGPVGSGKSTALRYVVTKKLPLTRFRVLYLADSDLTPGNFYREALYQLGIEPPRQRIEAKRKFMQRLRELFEEEKKIPVVIIDEAHLLGREMLEEMRFLTNQDFDSFSSLALLLVGQLELRRIMEQAIFEAIIQRVNVRYVLEGLTPEETSQYIAHQLRIAGVEHPLFTDAAVDEIFDFSQGIPRKINILCQTCLLQAYAVKKQLVDDQMVREVIAGEFSNLIELPL